MKKMMVFVIVVLAAASAFAANVWTGAAGDHRWTTSANWDLGYPDSANQLQVHGYDEEVYVVDGESISTSRMLWMFGGSSYDDYSLAVYFQGDSSFINAGYWYVYDNNTTGTEPNDGCVITLSDSAYVQTGSIALCTGNYDGTTGAIARANLIITDNARMYVTSTGSTSYRASGFVAPGDLDSYSRVRTTLSGSGVLEVNNLVIGDGEDVIIDVTQDGILRVKGDVESMILALNSAGQVVTDGDTTTPYIAYDGTWTNVMSPNNSILAKPNTPTPADGSPTNTIVDAAWTAGGAGSSWNLYLGTDAENLELVEAGLATPEYEFCGLEFGTTYYWRVDEVGASTTVEGDVWSFTTRTYYKMYWFEYADQTELETEWNASNSILGIETDIARGASSMTLTYDLSSSPYVNSAVSYSFPQENIACSSAYSMSVWVYGDVNNSDEQLSVSLTDGTNTSTVICDVPYVTQKADVDTDSSLIWTIWYIDLRDFEVNNPSIDMASIASMTIAVGDGTPGGSGTIYIDNVNLFPVMCVDAPEYDLNDDCLINLEDFSLLVTEWLANGIFPIITE